MNINVDRDACELHAQCVAVAPELFGIGADEELVYNPDPRPQDRAAAEKAVKSCPAQAILLTD